MDLSKYQELTGIKVSSSKAPKVQATINRVQSMLETMLGFTLDSDKTTENLYNELGKSQSECACPSDAVEANLADADAVQGAYRLFDYNRLDQYIHIDPFKEIYKVKLVYIKQGSDNGGVTIKTFSDSQIRVDIGRDGIGKYLELCRECQCDCNCSNCVQIAVDADWLWCDQGEIPTDLLNVFADMVTYYSNPKKDIKSENITTHSYTRFDNVAPEAEPSNLAVIKRYAGPNGSATVTPTTGGQGRQLWA